MRITREAAEQVAEEIAGAVAFSSYGERLEPVVDALVEGRSDAQRRKVARTVAAGVWGDGLRDDAAQALDRLEHELRETLDRVAAARDELDRQVSDNRLAIALVEQLGMDHLDEIAAMGERFDELERELEVTEPGERRAVALRAAAELGAPGIDADERYSATASFVSDLPDAPSGRTLLEQSARALARSLATDERRRGTREELAYLADSARGELPLLAEAIEELLGEPMPEDAGEDDVWVSALFGPAPVARP